MFVDFFFFNTSGTFVVMFLQVGPCFVCILQVDDDMHDLLQVSRCFTDHYYTFTFCPATN